MNLQTILKSKLTFPILSFLCVGGVLAVVYFRWSGSYLTVDNSLSAQYVRHAWGLAGANRISVAKDFVEKRSLIGLSMGQILDIFGASQVTGIDDEKFGKSIICNYPLRPINTATKSQKAAWLLIQLTKEKVTKAWIEP